MSLPIVAIVGSTGYVGSFLTHTFLEALTSNLVKEVRILTTQNPKDPKSPKLLEFSTLGGKIHFVTFSKKETLLAALKSVDIVISAMGTGPGSSSSRLVLLESLVQSGVDVYFPSEFGTNHYSPRFLDSLKHSNFLEKKEHFQEAKLKTGLKTVRLICSMIMEYTFGKWCGLDCATAVWKIPGFGETPVATSSCRDIGKFTLEASLLAWRQPDLVPDLLEVVSDTRTLKEYAEVFDKVSGRRTKLHLLGLEDAKQKYERSKRFLDVFPLLFETGANNLTREEAGGNKLLNDMEGKWKLKTIEEYAEETGGIPVL